MQDEKGRAGDAITPNREDAERDATSKETVSELEKSRGTSDEETGRGTDAGNASTPSPDGQFDGTRGGAGPEDESGPM
jgi:hypothetical protein